jgi:hypothetical protein
MKKIAIISLVLVLALGSLGVGYAHWTDQLYVENTVHGGTVAIVWDADEEPYLAWEDNESTFNPPKEVADGYHWYDDPMYWYCDPHTNKCGPEYAFVEVYNAYPGYEIHFTTLVVHNIGTVPVHIRGLDIWDPSGELEFVWTDPPGPAGGPDTMGYFWKDFNGDGVFDPETEEIINVEVVNFVCHQLEPCQSTKGELDLHFKQPMEQCHTYYFALAIDAVNYNEPMP